MYESGLASGQTRSAFLDEDRDAAVARVKSDWVRYIAQVEQRAISTGRSAERQTQLYRTRERERLDTLRELEERIADARARLSSEEAERQRRVAVLDKKIAQHEQHLANVEAAIESKEDVLGRMSRRISESAEETANAVARLEALAGEEREARERSILIQTQGDMQLREYEAKFRAINYRSNVIVAEAAEKVRLLHEIEKELARKVESLESQQKAVTGAVQANSPLRSHAPLPTERRVWQASGTVPSPTRLARGTTVRGGDNKAALTHTGVRHVSPSKISAMELDDLSLMLSQLEEQFRDSLVEVAAREFSRVGEEGEATRGADALLDSASTSALMEF